jgi:DNA-binding MarR family transcriptional regulator
MSFETPATVDELLNYRLASLLANSGAMTTRVCEGRYGITRREWRLIALLADYGAMSPSVLAERAHLERARISRLVADLIAKKLVLKIPQPTDKRRASLDLTARGRKLHQELFPQSVGFHQMVVAVLTPKQRAAFDEAMRLLDAHAQKVNESDASDAKADRRRGGSRRANNRLGSGDVPVWL